MFGYTNLQRCFLGTIIVLGLVSCHHGGGSSGAPTVEEAVAFVESVEDRLQELNLQEARAAWVQSNFITEDTQYLAATAQKNSIAAMMEFANEAARFNGLDLPEDLARKLDKLKTSMTLPAPSDADLQTELTSITTDMEGRYGKGEYCRGDGECLDLTRMTRILAESRNASELLKLWQGWRKVSPPMRPQYQRFVELANAGARELGYPDLGALWRSTYDMSSDEFAAELDRLWNQVKPLYDALHCHVRASLAKVYGPDLLPEGKPMPAHLQGNMWSQDWTNIYDLVAPPTGDPGYDLTKILEARNVDEREMVRIGERFFSSLGFEPLPETFWDRSLFTKPEDRDVVCHASAWSIDMEDDIRIKMCIQKTEEDFSTIHHELGHNYYQRAYKSQPVLFREGANGGFHEGIGDTLALSITPEYLVKIDYLDKAPGPDADLGLLMRRALEKVAFLPFGLLVDQWRWKVFSGEITPADYNKGWWDLRLKYQGIVPPVDRTEEDFDPGAKYHIPANATYERYFVAHILQFQFHRALCREMGFEGPLHRCSIYGDEAAGERLGKMLEMGSSRPWPEALAAMTGDTEMDATAIVDYFGPLMTWLDEQNEGRTCGW